MSRQELADVCNEALETRYAASARSRRWTGITAPYIGSLERGETRWPNEDYRAAFRQVLNATDAQLGFYIDRPDRASFHGDDDQPLVAGGPDIFELSANGQEALDAEAQKTTAVSFSAVKTTAISAEFGATPSHPEEVRPTAVGSDQSGQPVSHSVVDGGDIGLPQDVVSAVSELRRRLDHMLSATTINDSTVDYWSSVADGYGRVYRVIPPPIFLPRIAQDLAELHGLVERKVLTAQRRRLYQAMARMAGLLATTFVNLNDYHSARSWFQTAQRAADESGDLPVYSWVLLRNAVSALYWDDPYGALDLATRATVITRGRRCVAGIWAPAVQARAYSRLGGGYVKETHESISRAEQEFANFEARPGEQHAYGYTAAQLHFYRSNALTAIADTKSAYAAQEEALALCEPVAFLDSSLIRLDRAACLLRDGEGEEAARFTAKFLKSLPREHRSPLVIHRARQFAAAIPSTYRNLDAVRELQDALTSDPFSGPMLEGSIVD